MCSGQHIQIELRLLGNRVRRYLRGANRLLDQRDDRFWQTLDQFLRLVLLLGLWLLLDCGDGRRWCGKVRKVGDLGYKFCMPGSKALWPLDVS